MQRIHAYFLPQLSNPADLSGSTCVVIDVLRATTTIVHALAAGAKAVIPCLEVDDARQIAASLSPGEAILGGERAGIRIDGFHLGNSPAEYTPATVGGKTVVFTTTNGTRAMQHCRAAKRILLAAFVNFTAVCEQLTDCEQINLVCAGTDGQITREDVLLAGAITGELTRRKLGELNDQAAIAKGAWVEAIVSRGAPATDIASLAAPLLQALRASHGGRNLIELGLAGDIELAARVDQFSMVPQLGLASWKIT